MLYQIIAAVILIVILKLLPAFPTPVELVLYLIPYLVVAGMSCASAQGHQEPPAVRRVLPDGRCTVGAFALGDYVEGCAVILFYQIGELFQSVASARAARASPA